MTLFVIMFFVLLAAIVTGINMVHKAVCDTRRQVERLHSEVLKERD